jgi:CheY-like chemotaxis protein/anti-anti-sigma regulatory factor
MLRTDLILDADTIHTLPQEFREQTLYLDFSDASVITAGGLGQLVAWHVDLRAQGEQLILMHVGEQVCEVFEVTQLTQILDIRPIGRAPMERPALSAIPADTQPARRRSRVLLIEDNKDAATSLQLLLEIRGHEVVVADSGPAGVSMASAWRPEIVLSDIGLPGLDGWQVAEQLKRNAATAGARLIAVTGYSSDEARRRSLAVGYEAHLSKPVAPEDLLRMLVGPG